MKSYFEKSIRYRVPRKYPAQSSDFTSPDFCISGLMKAIVYREKAHTGYKLKAQITAKFEEIGIGLLAFSACTAEITH